MSINYNSGQINSTMKENGLSFKKRYGQNFLNDKSYLNRIAELSGDSNGVLEVGPGIGGLTSILSEKYEKVAAVEIDKELYEYLITVFDNSNVVIINDDVMNVDIPDLIKTQFGDERVSVTANLPYYITTPIIMKLAPLAGCINRITVMVQKEVAERLTAVPGSPDYGAITVSLSYYGKVKKHFTVPRGAFTPAPNVDSAVVTIDLYGDKPFKPLNEEILFRFIKGGFAKRRKVLLNSLLSEFPNDKELITDCLNKCEINPKARGETLSLADYIKLSDKYVQLKGI